MMVSAQPVTDTLSAAAAMVEEIHAPAYSTNGTPYAATTDERTARATEAAAYGLLAIAEELRALRKEIP